MRPTSSTLQFRLGSIILALCHSLVAAQSSSVAPSAINASRPTLGPRAYRREEPPAHLRGNPIPTTIAPSPSALAVVVPTLSPVTRAPNAARDKPYPTDRHRGPTDPPTLETTPATPPSCFSGDATVHVEGKVITTMKRLIIGDKVQDAHGKFVSVYSFGHYLPNGEAEYLLLYIQGLQKPLEVSKNHFVFQHGKAVPASQVHVGQAIDLGVAVDGSSRKSMGLVQHIQEAVRKGAFAPHTTSGTLLVNHVAVSSYVTAQRDRGVLVLFDRYPTAISLHWLTHVYLTPHRLLCSHLVGMSNCRKWETYNTDGLIGPKRPLPNG